jgi:hypothetical protein
MGRADRVLVKTGAAERFLVSASLTLLRLSEAGRLTGSPEFAAGLGKWRILLQCSRTQFDPVQGEEQPDRFFPWALEQPQKNIV